MEVVCKLGCLTKSLEKQMSILSSLKSVNVQEQVPNLWEIVPEPVKYLTSVIKGFYQPFPNGLVVGLCDFDPIISESLIEERNANNRPYIMPNLGYLESILNDNGFLLTGETIIFDWKGMLRNGQHRIRACVTTGKTMTSFAIFGVDPAVFPALDQGAKRAIAHVLSIDKEENCSTLGGALACLMNFKTQGRSDIHGKIRAVPQKFQSLLSSNPCLRESVSWASQKVNRCFPIPSVTAFMHYIFGLVNPNLRDEMVTGMVNMDMPTSDPKWDAPRYFRNYILGTRRKSMIHSRPEYGAMFIKTWNYFSKGVSRKEVRFRPDEAYPHVNGWTYKDNLPISCGEFVL